MMRRALRPLCLLFVLVAALAACDRRDLEVILDERVRVNLVIDWRVNFKEYYAEVPNGMTVMLWNVDNGARMVEATNDSSVTLRLEPATYHVIIMNDRTEEFLPYMQLRDAADYDRITMRSNHYRGDDGRDYLHYPEPIGVAVDTFVVTRDMIESDTTIFVYYDDYLAGNYDHDVVSNRVYEIPEASTPMTVTLYMKGKVKGRQYLKNVEASLSGMADGFYMSRVDRTTESGTLALDPKKWKLYREGSDADSLGVLTNATRSFGLPHGKELLSERAPEDNVLHLRLTLINDTIQEYDFNVGHDLHYIHPDGREAQIRYRQDLHDILLELDLHETIIVPPVEGEARGAGFEAEVDDWEDGGIIDINGLARRRKAAGR